MRKSEPDGNPAPLLLEKPVGILAGQRPNQRGLAVIDVPDNAEREVRHDGATGLVSVTFRQSRQSFMDTCYYRTWRAMIRFSNDWSQPDCACIVFVQLHD